MQKRIRLALVAGSLGVGALAVLVYGITVDQDAASAFQQRASASARALHLPPKLVSDVIRAPGHAELERAGCSIAGVLNRQQISSVVPRMELLPEVTEGVACVVRKGVRAPRCQELARVYQRAVSPKGGFVVSVTREGAGNVCGAFFSSQGELIQTVVEQSE